MVLDPDAAEVLMDPMVLALEVEVAAVVACAADDEEQEEEVVLLAPVVAVVEDDEEEDAFEDFTLLSLDWVLFAW